MTKAQSAAFHRLSSTMVERGFSIDEMNAMLKIERSIHRWQEAECNGDVEIDETSGLAYRYWTTYDGRRFKGDKVPNRETIALRKLTEMFKDHPDHRFYVQGDCRGCALYIYRPADLDGRDIDSYYSTIGVAVCY